MMMIDFVYIVTNNTYSLGYSCIIQLRLSHHCRVPAADELSDLE